MKRLISVLVALAVLSSAVTAWHDTSHEDFCVKYPNADSCSAAERGITPTIMLNGQALSLSLPAYIDPRTGRTMFPLREVAETLGALVEWIDGQIWVFSGDHLVGFRIGSHYMTWDGEYREIDQAPVLRVIDGQGYTYVPLRSLVEKLGGRVDWHGGSGGTIDLTYIKDPKVYTPTWRGSCALHGYGEDDCPAGRLLIPQVYTSFGYEKTKRLVAGGIMADEAIVAYFNKLALLHEGKPPRTVKEAVDETVNQLIIDIAIAELIGLLWLPSTQQVKGEPRQTQACAFCVPKGNGWAVNPQYMSEEAITYQSRVTGKPFTIGSGANHWIIEEYGYGIFGQTKFWFDGRIGNRLLDAKAHSAKAFVDARTGQLQPWFTKSQEKGAPALLRSAQAQLRAAGELQVEWHFKDQKFMVALMDYFRQVAPEVVDRIFWIHNPL